MKKLNSIFTRRETASIYPSFKIVFEWEDIIASQLQLTFQYERKFFAKVRRHIDNIGLAELYNTFVLPSSKLSLFFVMNASKKNTCLLTKNVIPVIIDFWLKEEDLYDFYKAYKHCPLVLLTNLEVYNFLKNNNCPLNIEHWPLSFPDQYKLGTINNDKEYEFCIIGRPNPYFIRLLDEYCKNHADFIYVKNNGDINHRIYVTNQGTFVAEDKGRSTYLEMIRKTKISCYSTPGIDEAKGETKYFNQVTPRLFELLSGGCQVIGHYPDSADTQYYQLQNIVPNVDNYEQFETVLNQMRKTSVDIKKNQLFLSKHYTSTRVSLLREILIKYNRVH